MAPTLTLAEIELDLPAQILPQLFHVALELLQLLIEELRHGFAEFFHPALQFFHLL